MGQGSQRDKFMKIKKFLQYQEKGLRYPDLTNERCKELIGYATKVGLYNAMTRNGFKYNKENGVFVGELPSQSKQINIDDAILNKNSDDYNSNNVVLQDDVKVDYNSNNNVLQDNINNNYSCNIDVTTRERFNKCLSNVDNINRLIDIIENSDRIFESMKANERAKSKFKVTFDRTEPIVAANYRMNKKIKDRFTEFCNKQTDYKVQDIISQAVLEFLETYDKE